MNKRTKQQIENRKQIEKEIKFGFKKLVNLDIWNILQDDLNYLENISLSVDSIICEVLENKLLSYIKDDDLREFIQDGLNNSNLYELYDIDNRIYLNLVKEIVLHFKDDNMDQINDFKDKFYNDLSDDDIENIENFPQLEIQLDIIDNFNKPLNLFGDRLCYNDDSINPSDSIMVYMDI